MVDRPHGQGTRPWWRRSNIYRSHGAYECHAEADNFMFLNQQLGCAATSGTENEKSGGARHWVDSDDQRPQSWHHAMPFFIVTERKNADDGP
jgi:hypothetical protein